MENPIDERQQEEEREKREQAKFNDRFLLAINEVRDALFDLVYDVDHGIRKGRRRGNVKINFSITFEPENVIMDYLREREDEAGDAPPEDKLRERLRGIVENRALKKEEVREQLKTLLNLNDNDERTDENVKTEGL